MGGGVSQAPHNMHRLSPCGAYFRTLDSIAVWPRAHWLASLSPIAVGCKKWSWDSARTCDCFSFVSVGLCGQVV